MMLFLIRIYRGAHMMLAAVVEGQRMRKRAHRRFNALGD